MAGLKFSMKFNDQNVRRIQKAASEALFLTMEAVHTDVVQAQVMPFDTGTMQNESTFVKQINDNHVSLITSTAYAQRLYFHPEYDFSKASNPNAQGRWLDEWISGSKKDWVQDTFSELLKQRLT
jgi:hypothetical protein